MRSAEETLELFKQALEKRRAYVRRRLQVLDQAEEEYKKETQWGGRGRRPQQFAGRKTMRGGMLSELTTVTYLLSEIQAGKLHPDEIYNVQDDPTEPC